MCSDSTGMPCGVAPCFEFLCVRFFYPTLTPSYNATSQALRNVSTKKTCRCSTAAKPEDVRRTDTQRIPFVEFLLLRVPKHQPDQFSRRSCRFSTWSEAQACVGIQGQHDDYQCVNQPMASSDRPYLRSHVNDSYSYRIRNPSPWKNTGSSRWPPPPHSADQ
ncbi:uncharacterized protein LOC142774724 [Rhipicephalus microplus]|uniref:uncharacterized protein LOC142774724 n=1 Tax=Rhipicephalus microplus TaxID=6941 RepID=UPI003F6BD251